MILAGVFCASLFGLIISSISHSSEVFSLKELELDFLKKRWAYTARSQWLIPRKIISKGSFDEFKELIIKKFVDDSDSGEGVEFGVILSLDNRPSLTVGPQSGFVQTYHLAKDLSARLNIPIIDETKSVDGIKKVISNKKASGSNPKRIFTKYEGMIPTGEIKSLDRANGKTTMVLPFGEDYYTFFFVMGLLYIVHGALNFFDGPVTISSLLFIPLTVSFFFWLFISAFIIAAIRFMPQAPFGREIIEVSLDELHITLSVGFVRRRHRFKREDIEEIEIRALDESPVKSIYVLSRNKTVGFGRKLCMEEKARALKIIKESLHIS